MGLHRPRHYLACLAFRQHATQHKPTILCQHATVVEFQFSIVAADTDHALWRICSQRDVVTSLQRQWVDEAVGTTVVIGLETLELARLLAVGTGNGLAGGITGQTT